ncbi:uncharacterized protein KY384_004353 [Bacidia gigantensis]|uniref:uncharacterized protein n=1 Tax=Bacidia gigantensis TaxID=2732470 RepID=UPI001D0367CC|nr:uncharacterized protein KY384_004353 [Bacidia gigantensis]KAG8530996.1 hypothetical protein KY384_004353 [Bacidia gigantensis]
MSGMEVVAIVGCVAAVVSAFEHGDQLVKKLREKRMIKKKGALPPEMLDCSLQMGPPAVRLAHDGGRLHFGRAFEHGDRIANEAFKDIIIQLQGQLLRHLLVAQEDDGFVHDFGPLVDASDFGRLRSVTVLNELFMRLAERGPIESIPGASHRRHNSTATHHVGRLPDNHQASEDLQGSEQVRGEAAPIDSPEQVDLGLGPRRVKTIETLGGETPSQKHPTRIATDKEDAAPSTRKQAIQKPGVSHHHPSTPPTPPPKDHPHNAPSSPSRKRYQVSFPRPASMVEGFFRDDNSKSKSASASSDGSSNLHHAHRGASPEYKPALKRASSARAIREKENPVRKWASMSSGSSPKNTDCGGFCPGACTIRTGNQGMILRNQSVSMTGESYYWGCSNSMCSFEGYAVKTGREWGFDETIREMAGVRYRWRFLAKSHIVPDHRTRHRIYDYQCILCKAQGQETKIVTGERAFIEHVSTHRNERRNPFGMQLIVAEFGRVALEEEPWDVNLLPRPEDLQRRRAPQIEDQSTGLGISMNGERARESPVDTGFHHNPNKECSQVAIPTPEVKDVPLRLDPEIALNEEKERAGQGAVHEETTLLHPAMRQSFMMPDPWRASYVTMQGESTASIKIEDCPVLRSSEAACTLTLAKFERSNAGMSQSQQRLSQIQSHLSSSEADIPRGRDSLLRKFPDDVVVTCALRTPFTKGGKGGLKDTAASDLLVHSLQSLLSRSNISPELVEDVAVGSVLPPGGGATEFRAAALVAGFPESTAVKSLNRQCSSGLQACVDIANAIRSGMIDVGIGAGVESMSMQYGPGAVTEFSELLESHPEAKNCKVPMGMLSEQMAKDRGIKRKDQDAFAASSYQKALAAQKEGRFDEEIAPLTGVKWVDPKTDEEKIVDVSKDDGIREGVTKEGLGKIKASFAKDGSIHAGNASQISDGAAAVLLMKRSTAERLGQKIVGKFVSSAIVGVKPLLMGIGPWKAIPVALQKARISKEEVDIYEINEAFASQCLWCIRELGLDEKKVNPNGGAIAFGHPLGCTGARQVSTLFNELGRRKQQIGVTSMCVGTGMGMAAVWVKE